MSGLPREASIKLLGQHFGVAMKLSAQKTSVPSDVVSSYSDLDVAATTQITFARARPNPPSNAAEDVLRPQSHTPTVKEIANDVP